MTLEELQVLITSETSGLRKELANVKKELGNVDKEVKERTNRIKDAFKVVTATVATVAVAVGTALVPATKEATAFEASLQQIQRLMGSNAKAFEQWANENAANFGMARAEAIRYGATYANLLSNFSQSTAETTQRTEDLLKTSAIVASATGRSLEDVMERIRSGLLGETDAIEDLGINVNVAMLESTKAFQRFANGKSWQQLNYQTQQTILYYAILEQAARKYGDELAQNTASRQAAFIAQLKDAQLALGQAFLPIYNIILPALTSMAAALAEAMRFVAAFSQALFGTGQVQQTKATESQAAAVGGLGDAYEKAGKQAKGALAGFDEINQLADQSGSGAEGSGIGTAPLNTGASEGETSGISASMEELSTKAQEMAEKVKAAIGTMKDIIVQNKEIIVAALAGIAAGFTTAFIITNWSSIIGGISTALGLLRGSVLGLWSAITGPIGIVVASVALLTAAFVYFYQTNETFRGVVDGILAKIGEVAMWIWQNVLVPFGQWLGAVFVAAWNAVSEAASWLWQNVLVPFGAWLLSAMIKAWDAVSAAAEWFWKNVLVPIGDFLAWFWKNVIVPLGGVLSDVLAVAFQFVSDVAKSFWENVLIPLGNALNEMFKPAVEAVSAVLTFLWQKVMQPLASFISGVLKVVFEALTKTIEFLWKEVLKPVAEYVGGAFKTTFDNVFTSLGTIIEGLKKTFNGLMGFITGVFTQDWEKAWNGVKDIFKGVFESLWGIVKFPLNQIIDGINTMIEGLNKINIDIPDWVPGKLGGKSFGINIPRIPKLASGGIVDANDPMLAIIGDNPTQKEAVAPLDDLKNMIVSAVGTAFLSIMQVSGGNQGNNNGDIVIQIDGTTLARILTPYLNREQQRIGTTAIIQPI